MYEHKYISLTTISHFDTHANILITNSSQPHTLLLHKHFCFCTWTWQLKILTSALSLHSRFQAAWMLFYRSRCVPYLTSLCTRCTHCQHSQALSFVCNCMCVYPEPERVDLSSFCWHCFILYFTSLSLVFRHVHCAVVSSTVPSHHYVYLMFVGVFVYSPSVVQLDIRFWDTAQVKAVQLLPVSSCLIPSRVYRGDAIFFGMVMVSKWWAIVTRYWRGAMIFHLSCTMKSCVQLYLLYIITLFVVQYMCLPYCNFDFFL